MLTQKRIKVNFHVFKLKFNFLIVSMVAKTQCLYCSSFHLEGQKVHRLQQCRSRFTGISSMGFPRFCQFYSCRVYFYYGLFIIHVSNQLFFVVVVVVKLPAVNCNALAKAGAVGVLFKVVTSCGHKRVICLKWELQFTLIIQNTWLEGLSSPSPLLTDIYLGSANFVCLLNHSVITC